MNLAAYLRYSSDNQREESIEAQLKYVTDYATQNGHKIVKVYIDEAKTATTDRRPGFLEMIKDSAKGIFDSVIVYKLDRFSRDRYDFSHYRRTLKRNGVRILSVTEPLDNSPESIILESVLEGMAEYYSRNLAREVMQKGMLPNAEKCLHNGGTPPLGYDVGPDQRYLINEHEAEAIRIIFDMFAAGNGYSKIIDTLAEKGYKTKLGNGFSKNSLYIILTNEKYKGVYVFNKTQRKHNDNGSSNVKKPDEEIIKVEGGMPAIVSKETWDTVANIMMENKKTCGNANAKRVYILSGKVYCGKCKSAMVGNSFTGGRNKEKYFYYECGNRKRTRTCDAKNINAFYIENEVVNSLYDNILSPESIDNFVDRVFEYSTKQKKGIPEYIKSAKKELTIVEKDIDRIVTAITDGMYHQSMKQKMDELEDKKSTILMRLAEAEYEAQAYAVSKKQIKEYVQLFQNIKNDPPEEQKKAIGIFVDRIYVYENNVEMEILNPFNTNKNKGTSVDSSSVWDCGDGGGLGNTLSQTNPEQSLPFMLISIDISNLRHMI